MEERINRTVSVPLAEVLFFYTVIPWQRVIIIVFSLFHAAMLRFLLDFPKLQIFW